MKKILLLIRPENTESENRGYIDAIEKFGGKAVFVHDDDLWNDVLVSLREVEGVLLSGGDSVGKLDYKLIDYALTNDLKLLGICQGMQSMAMYGCEDVLISIGNDGHYLKGKYCHRVELEKDSIVYNIAKKNVIGVNSYHYQTVLKSHCFKVTGRSVDGLIECIENDNGLFQLGVQWHPERMIEYDDVSYKLIEMFITK